MWNIDRDVTNLVALPYVVDVSTEGWLKRISQVQKYCLIERKFKVFYLACSQSEKTAGRLCFLHTDLPLLGVRRTNSQVM